MYFTLLMPVLKHYSSIFLDYNVKGDRVLTRYPLTPKIMYSEVTTNIMDLKNLEENANTM